MNVPNKRGRPRNKEQFDAFLEAAEGKRAS